jgi:nucleoid-associated protein YgaU
MAAIEFFVPELRNPEPASQPELQQAAASTPTPATPNASGGAGTAVAPFSPSVVPTFVTTYIVTKHDCLSKIAERIYGRQLWRKIYAANRNIIRNPDIIYPGQVLSIPSP